MADAGQLTNEHESVMHVMYDFETMGQTPDTQVVSLGAVAFNRDGVLGKKYWVFDWDNQPGRTRDADTAAWWARQSNEAKQVFFTPPEKKISLEAFIADNDDWISGLCFELGESQSPKTGQWKELKPWGNGANFDIVILEDIYRRNHPKGKASIPWAFWNVWCFRTFDALTKCKELKAKNIERKGADDNKVVKHNALADALWQAECVIEHWKRADARKVSK